jgi:hypothetical protein
MLSWIKRLIGAAIAVVVLLLVVGGVAYASDYAVEATVVSKDCSGALRGNGSVTVQAKLLPIEYTATGLGAPECSAVNTGNFVKYHLRSERVSLYQSEGGRCIYDTEHGVGGCDK